MIVSGNEPGLAGTITIIKRSNRERMNDGENLSEKDGGGYWYRWSTNGLGCGEYGIRITLRDRCGNERVRDVSGSPDLVIQLVDTTPPVVARVWASESEYIENHYHIGKCVTIHVEDKYLERSLRGTVDISFPGGARLLSGELTESPSPGIYTYTWNTSSLSAGDYWVETILSDEWGNEDRDGLSTHPDLRITLEDITPPTIISVHPPDGAENVNVNTIITVGFDEEILKETFSSGFEIKDSDGRPRRGSWRYVPENNRFEFTPQEALVHNRTYVCSLLPDVSDLAGNMLGEEYSWSFKTSQPPLVNSPPEIIHYLPHVTTVYAAPSEIVNFSVEVRERDMDSVDIKWYVNGEIVIDEYDDILRLLTPLIANGTVIYQTIKVEVSDGEFYVSHKWILIVSDSGKGMEELGPDEDEKQEEENVFRSSRGRKMIVLLALVLIAIVLSYILYRRKKA